MAKHHASILIAASPQSVFDALTKPELVRSWQYEKELITDWKPGSRILFRATFEGRILEQWGTVLEVRPNELVKYKLFTPLPGMEDKAENYCLTSYVLSSENNSTKAEIIQEDNRPDSFVPLSLLPILAALKRTAESLPA